MRCHRIETIRTNATGCTPSAPSRPVARLPSATHLWMTTPKEWRMKPQFAHFFPSKDDIFAHKYVSLWH
ncbi:hypothetical protein HMPREF9135_1273 [Segatella baroniae F0067]|uniref:Uncharacterized protein n=1 Tax=Segatella baroniae F0067 TaxID=1115809 RepID=U2P8N7_9BACT|nr:hypothetical protein HMPREF9135_1273 [Segatella baroniae F0067]